VQLGSGNGPVGEWVLECGLDVSGVVDFDVPAPVRPIDSPVLHREPRAPGRVTITSALGFNEEA
jgi:hypothetical protein